MPTLHIEHRVADFDGWKRNGFDADPVGRVKGGVLAHRISRGVDDPNHVMIELEFNSVSEAEAMHAALRDLWRNPLVKIGGPTARIMETVEAVEY